MLCKENSALSQEYKSTVSEALKALGKKILPLFYTASVSPRQTAKIRDLAHIILAVQSAFLTLWTEFLTHCN